MSSEFAQAAVNVQARMEQRLARLDELIAADAAFDPKAAPNKDYINERIELRAKIRSASILAEVFAEAGL